MSKSKKILFFIFGGVAIVSASICYYYYKKFIHFTFSPKLLDYIEDLKDCIRKYIGNSDNNVIKIIPSRLPIELFCLVLLSTNELLEDTFLEEYPNKNELRLDYLKELNNDISQNYYTEVLEQIEIKNNIFDKSFNQITNLLSDLLLELSYTKINITIYNFFAQFETMNPELLKSTLAAYKRFSEPEDSLELEYYKRMRIKMNEENEVIKFTDYLIELVENQSDLIKQKRQTKNNLKLSNDNKKIVIVNEIMLRDSIKLNFGIGYEHFIYLLENSSIFQKNVEIRMKYDKLDEKDRFIYI